MEEKYRGIITLLCLLLFITGCNQVNDKKEEQNNIQIEDEQKKIKPSSDGSNQNEIQIDDIEAAYRLNDKTWSIEPIGDANEKIVLITIDDAPDQYALDMAETLETLGVHAIFFVNGHFLETDQEKDTLQAIYDKGFLIGNHTYSHTNLQTISEEEQKDEIIRVNDMVEEIIGERPKFFRAPHGANTDFSRVLAEKEGMVLMNWTYGYDYFQPYMDKEKITEAMVSGEGPEVDVPYSLLRPGANLLMHDREWTALALYDIVIGLQEKGYEIVDPRLIETIEHE